MNKFRSPSGVAVRSALWYVKVAVFALLATAGLIFVALALQKNPEGHPVVVAKKDMEAGQEADPTGFRVLSVPKKAVPARAVTSLQRIEQVPLVRDIPANTILTEDLLDADGTRTPAKGFSHVAVALDDAPKFLEVGDEVEVWGEEPGCDLGDCPVVMLSTPALVTAIEKGSGSSFDPHEATNVYLQVRYANVGKVLQAAKGGSIQFVLRPAAR